MPFKFLILFYDLVFFSLEAFIVWILCMLFNLKAHAFQFWEDFWYYFFDNFILLIFSELSF